ncbi:MAG: hypothetical protein R6W06_03025 [Prochlorococcaceae cyanobacterium]
MLSFPPPRNRGSSGKESGSGGDSSGGCGGDGSERRQRRLPRPLNWKSGSDASPELLRRESVRRWPWAGLRPPGLHSLVQLGKRALAALAAGLRWGIQALGAGRREALWSLERGVHALQHLEERQERKAQEWATRPLLLRDLLGRGGWALLALYAARVLTSMLPFQLYAPEWYVRLGGELINTSPVLITAFVLLLSAGVINQNLEGPNRLPRLQVVLWFVQLALWVYLLAIPTQVVASVLVVQRAEARLEIQWSWVQRELATARQRQATPEEFKQLGEIEDRLKQQRNSGQRQIRFNLVREAVRVCLSAGVLVWALRLPLGALERDQALL